MEWVLVLTLSLSGAPEIGVNFTPSVISGFSSKLACEGAGKKISERLVSHTAQHFTVNRPDGFNVMATPKIWYDCISIRK